MRRRQTVPGQWLIVADEATLEAARRLPRGSGILALRQCPACAIRRLRAIAVSRELTLVEEGRGAKRVHDLRELRSAMLRRTPLILLSPLYRTSSHPDWKPLPRMRAAALARLGGRKLVALGGMDARRFARIKPLGFQGWAGISAFRT